MTRLERKLLSLLLWLVAAGAIAFHIYMQEKRIDAAQAAATTATADASAATTEAKGIERVYKQREESRRDTNEALDAHPEYRDAPVPDAIACRLREHTHPCREAARGL